MKLKLSPFTILFLLLNSLLIFCASSNIDSEKKPSSSLKNTNLGVEATSNNNLRSHANSASMKTTKIVDKPSHGIGYTITDRSSEYLKSNIAIAAKDFFAIDADKQKIKTFYGTSMDSISKDELGISTQFPDKIDAIVSHSK